MRYVYVPLVGLVIDASVYSPSFARLIEELDVTLDACAYLGSYSEMV